MLYVIDLIQSVTLEKNLLDGWIRTRADKENCDSLMQT